MVTVDRRDAFGGARVAPDRSAGPKIVPLANAVTAVLVALYAVCVAVSFVAPGLYAAVVQAWFHGLVPGVAGSTGLAPTVGEFAIGLLTLTGVAWIGTAAVAWLYRNFAHR